MTNSHDISHENAKAAEKQLPQAANIIAIASGKGGVGKTWLAITLAHHIARSGRRVLLFDGDIGLANVDVQLGLTPERDLASVFAGKAALKDVITSYDGENLDIIAGRSGSGGFGVLPAAKLEKVKEELLELAKVYDVILLDLGAGVEHHVRSLSQIAARCLVVVTDEPTSMTDAYAFIKLSSTHTPRPEIQIVVNQASTQKEGERTYAAMNKACSTFLKFSPTLAGIVRRDPKVKDAIRNQKPLVVRSPSSTAATDTAALSVKLMVRN